MASAAWMLDTNVLCELIRDPRGALASRVTAESAGAICTSIIVACELRFGALRKGSSTLIERVDQLLDRLDVMALDADVDRHYADIRSALERAGTPIGSHDLFIAAHARCLELTLVTRNRRGLMRVPGLRIETW
jgi:tRNA(fMet)-specific endonuclease VapC